MNWRVPLGALFFTALFFFEYTGLGKRVHIPFDLEGYHYPLVDAAFIMLRNGQLPLWDFSTYCGIPLMANIQAALFYPITWVMFLANAGKAQLPYSTVEYGQLAQIWLGFCFCFFWLHRGRGVSTLGAILGAASFAYGGYTTAQITHWGLIGCMIWIPLGFWAIDRWNDRPSFRSIALLAMATSLALLAGYSPAWACYCVCICAYAAASVRHVRSLAAALAALALGCLFGAAQLIPTAEASQFKTFDPKYGEFTRIWDLSYYAAYVVPNLYDFELGVEVGKNPGKDNLYLGAATIACILLFLGYARRKEWARAWPGIAALLASAAFFTNPLGVLGRLIQQSKTLAQIFNDWYFLAGAAAAAPLLVALGFDAVKREGVATKGLAWILLPVSFSWSAYLFSIWNWKWRHMAVESEAVHDGIIGVALFALVVWLWRNSQGRQQMIACAALLVMAAVDFKVYGTSKRLNASPGTIWAVQTQKAFPGIHPEVFAQLRRNKTFRIELPETGPDPGALRHAMLATVQGFDPFIPAAYSELATKHGGVFRSSRHFWIPPRKETFELFGIRYVIVGDHTRYRKEAGAAMEWLVEMEPIADYRVFEYKDAKPAYSWPGKAVAVQWEPARRVFHLEHSDAANFRLAEQFYPGWVAKIDGRETAIQRCELAFQCVEVPAGTHELEFSYQPLSVRIGCAISAVSILTAALICRTKKK